MSTWVILAGGPSLTQVDVDACRGKARVLAIKEAIRLAPWADVFYAADMKWWRHYGDTLGFEGPKYAIENYSDSPTKWATVLKNTGELGLEIEKTGLRTGRNSGYQAINLAVHLGATRIVLLGYDMQPTGGKEHWFPNRPPSYSHAAIPFADFLRCFASILAPLQTLGVEVINASRTTALRCFPCLSLDEALT